MKTILGINIPTKGEIVYDGKKMSEYSRQIFVGTVRRLAMSSRTLRCAPPFIPSRKSWKNR
jgi:ABC-type cobalamin/Fe3+-siderophores transport system ATPase subunit